MLTISGLKKFYFVPDINDMRCGAHRLLEIVKHKHHLNTSNGDVFIFMSKNQRTVKMVNFEENAYYVHQKTFANGYTFMKLKFVEDKPVYSIDWKVFLYIKDGRYCIDRSALPLGSSKNSIAERTLRPMTVERKRSRYCVNIQISKKKNGTF